MFNIVSLSNLQIRINYAYKKQRIDLMYKKQMENKSYSVK